MSYSWGSVNSYVVNERPVNSSSLNIDGIVIAAATIVTIQQTVAISVAASAVVSIAQDVKFKSLISGTIIDIEQRVNAVFSGNIINIEQRVYDVAANTFFNRNGWDMDITIDGYVIPHDRIFKDVMIYTKENESNQATFSLLVSNPVAFIDSVWGKNVTIDYTTASGSDRIFTGVVSIPEIDIINKNVQFTCSNNRDEIINNTLSGFVKTVGRYSEAVQGEYNTPAEEMNLRMQSVAYSLDFNGTNSLGFNPWHAKATPDFVLSSSDVYYRDPRVVWQDRTAIKNSIDISVKYQYTRLYHYQREFGWTHPYSFCEHLFGGYSLPSVGMIEQAIANAKWIRTAPIIYTSVWPPGSCVDGASIFYWNTSSLANRGTYSTVFDSLGNVISDPDGNNIYGFRSFTKEIDKNEIYVIGAAWAGSARFSQFIEEDYKINVKSTQSINQFGLVLDGESTDLEDDFDASAWEDYTVFTPMPAGATTFAGGSYYFNKDTNPGALSGALLTSVDIAKTVILSTHRNTQVIIETPIKPKLNLSHTVQITSSKVNAKGKVQEITHKLDVTEGKDCTTTLTLALFRSQGAATTTPTFVPSRPADSISLPYEQITLESHFGDSKEEYNGMIGNKNNPRKAGTPIRTDVDEEFRVDTPAIPDAFRKVRNIVQTASFEIAIPNDALEIIL